MRAALEASMRRSRAGASTRRDADAVAAEVVKRRQDEEAQPAADAAGRLGCVICRCQGRDTAETHAAWRQQAADQMAGTPAYHAESFASSLCGMGPHSPPLVPMLTAARAPACD